MPGAKRRKLGVRSLHKLTGAQRSHLECGCYFFDFLGEIDHFVDEAHRRGAWEAHRDAIMAAWDRAGERPDAFWQYDRHIKGTGPKGWRWPRGIESEAHMVHRLLTRGEIEPVRRGAWWRTESELAEIERTWLEYVRQGAGSGDGAAHACDWGGVPRAFWRAHAPRIAAEMQAEAQRWRASLREARGNGQLDA